MPRPLDVDESSPQESSPVTLHKISVQGRNGPIDLIVQVVEPSIRRSDRDLIDIAPAVLHAAADASMPRNSSAAHSLSLDYFRTQPVTSGATVGKYTLGRKLGEGTFGVVFAARDSQLERDVAVKVLLPDHVANSEIRKRFVEEGKATARIDHPGIVTVFDCGVEDGCAYLAMELLRGESLTSRLARSGRLAPATAMEITRQLASALEAAHRAGVIHRDLKPDNIFLVPDSGMATGERVKVLDFGLAKLGRDSRTAAKLVFGTPRYMSPEQTRSAATVDARSDVYALGCILFELVCGVPPFDGDVLEVVRAHQQRKAPRAAAVVRSLPTELDRLLTAMLAKSPDDRPQSMAAVQRALEASGALQPGPTQTMAPTLAEQVRAAKAAKPEKRARRPSVSNPEDWPLRPLRVRGTPAPSLIEAVPESLVSIGSVSLFPRPASVSGANAARSNELAETITHEVYDGPNPATPLPPEDFQSQELSPEHLSAPYELADALEPESSDDLGARDVAEVTTSPRVAATRASRPARVSRPLRPSRPSRPLRASVETIATLKPPDATPVVLAGHLVTDRLVITPRKPRDGRRPRIGVGGVVAILAVMVATFVIWRGYFAGVESVQVPVIQLDSAAS